MGGEEASDSATRTLHVNSRSSNAAYRFPTNYIRTTKYTLLTFLPKNLIQQFKKMSNDFFLLNMVIALVPGVSPVFPATTIMPLVAVLSVAAGRDAYEDYQRYKSDKRANALETKILECSTGKTITIASKDIQVGDVVYLERGVEMAVDCLIISTSAADGACFVETANLDGETNIKPKAAKTVLHKRFNSPSTIPALSGTIECDTPNESLHKWLGKISVPDVPSQAVDIDNFLLRGCTIRNVDWVIAVAVYTGIDTKLFWNLTQKPPKSSRLDEKLNRLIIQILIIQQIIIVALCILHLSFRHSAASNAAYLEYFATEYSDTESFFRMYMTFFVLLSLMMPISLFVSLEFCKTAQAKLMEWDVEMTNKGDRMRARTSSLNEELSQVQYVFTDKTGTLTENLMRFARAYTADMMFDELELPGEMMKIVTAGKPKETASQIWTFLRHLSLCNAVVINTAKDGTISYDGSSTDEVALVNTAASNGFRLLARSNDVMSVEILKVTFDIELLTILPFTPERKMMSVVIKEKDGAIRLLTKGADSSVLARLAAGGDKRRIDASQQFLDECSRVGLRTLVCAERVLPEDEYKRWRAIWDDAILTVTSDREAKVHKAALEGEKELHLVGCTAIEDKLQDGVPETIQFLLRCGITVWVLTGDKRETAVNIASTSKLLDPEKDFVVHLDIALQMRISDQIEQAIQQAERASAKRQKTSFIVDGKSLEEILLPQNFQRFQDLGRLVNSAVCCRVTPLQKARIVGMFQSLGATCVGIGDGANDVSMIQEARVGVGILGLEGSQAERASDYALPRFRHLRRLLAIHGRYSLVRNSNLILYSFYKNLVYSLTQCFYAFYSGFSGQTIYDSWAIIFFNMLFTLLPPLVMGIFDYDIRDKFVMKHPGLYAELRSAFAVRMSRASSWLWFWLAVVHSWIIFYGVNWATFASDDADGHRAGGLWVSGTIMMNLLLAVVICQAALSFLTFTWIHVASIVLSFASYTLFVFIYASVPPTTAFGDYYGVPIVSYRNNKMWLTVMLWFCVIFAVEIAAVVFRRTYFGINMHIARHADYMMKKQLPWIECDPNSPTSAALEAMRDKGEFPMQEVQEPLLKAPPKYQTNDFEL